MDTTVFSRRPVAALLAALAVFALSACDQNPLARGEEGVAQGGMSCKFNFSTCVSVLKPPVIIEATGFRTVAIVPGRERGSDAMVTQFESRLSKVRVNDLPYYKVVPANDPKREATFEISATTLTTTDSQVTEQRCNTVGNKIVCGMGTMHPVACTVRKGVAGATLRLRKRDGVVLATRQEGATSESKACFGEAGALAEPGEALGTAVDALMAKLQDLAAMSAERQPVRVMEDASQIKDPARRQRFTEATAFHKAGRLDRSCPVYDELIEIERSSVALFYNSAFCQQAKGDWGRANSLYRQADALTTTPSKDVQIGIKDTSLSAAQATR